MRVEDADDLTEMMHSLVEEGADIHTDERRSREEVIDWIAKRLSLVEKGDAACLVAEMDRRTIANSEIIRRTSGHCVRHVGELGIVIKRGYRDIGIGTELIKRLLEQAQMMGLEIILLWVFATNMRAIRLYKKFGFQEAGKIAGGIFRCGKYIDEVLMTLSPETPED